MSNFRAIPIKEGPISVGKIITVIIILAIFGGVLFYLLKKTNSNLTIMAPQKIFIKIDDSKAKPERTVSGFCFYNIKLQDGEHRIDVQMEGKKDFKIKINTEKYEKKIILGLNSSGEIDLLN